MKLPSGIFGVSDQKKRADLINSLIRFEARLGGELFSTPKGHRRQFFCLDETTWVWHEEWTDANKRRQTSTTRYIVRPDCVVKALGDGNYQRLSDTEAGNLYKAALAYRDKVHGAYQKLLAPVS